MKERSFVSTDPGKGGVKSHDPSGYQRKKKLNMRVSNVQRNKKTGNTAENND